VTRWASGNNATAAALRSLGMVVLADIHFDTGTLYVHDGYVQLLANSQTYSGLGEFGGIDLVSEDLSNVANPITLTLSGVDPAYISDVMTEHCQGRIVTLYVGLLDVNLWEGRMDFPQIELSQGQATIRVTCEHRLMREPQVARYTDQDQQIAHPGDTFFNLQWQIPLSTASWGKLDVFHPANQAPFSNRGDRGADGGGGGSKR
jgi:hypothetical protein